MDKITGKLTGVAGLSGTLSTSGSLAGTIGIPEKAPIDPYTGPYSIIPRLDEQFLVVKGFRMMDDVTVCKIPVVMASNTFGGKTVVIG